MKCLFPICVRFVPKDTPELKKAETDTDKTDSDTPPIWKDHNIIPDFNTNIFDKADLFRVSGAKITNFNEKFLSFTIVTDVINHELLFFPINASVFINYSPTFQDVIIVTTFVTSVFSIPFIKRYFTSNLCEKCTLSIHLANIC